MIPPHIVDEIMQTARIEEVIGEFVSLKKKGSSYMGLSPFTDEKTPSFSVSPSKQIFKCFSTGKGGTVVSFLMEKEHYTYPEALRWLADKYGIVLPEEKAPTAEEMAAHTEKESLFIINDFAKNHFVKNMFEHDEGKAIGLSYFEERGFRSDIIKKFELGYCLNKGDDFTLAAQEKKYKQEYVETVGLVKSKDDRKFDFFRGRVMFPIHSITGRILGFGGRTLQTEKKVAKYYNSPESPIYHKSDILYGLYFAKNDIIKYDNCFLCEGYTDVISMYQAGTQNVVSSSGTSLTKEQIKLIRRYTKNITILYDGDNAGIKASFRGIDLILEEGMSVKVVLFPEGEDPDSFAKNNSTTVLEDYLKDHAQDFVSFKSEILLKDAANDPLKKAELIRDVVSSVGLIPDSIVRSVYAQEVAAKFDIDEDIVIAEIAKSRAKTIEKKAGETKRAVNVPNTSFDTTQTSTPTQKHTEQVKPKATDQFDSSEFELIRVLVKYGVFAIEIPSQDKDGKEITIETSVAELICHELEKDELTLDYPLFNKIHSMVAKGLEESTFFQPSYFLRNEDQELVRLVSDIESEEYELSPSWFEKLKIITQGERDKLPRLIMDTVYSFKVAKISKLILEIKDKIEKLSEDENADFSDLMSQQIRLDSARKVFLNKLGRIYQ
ncbi:MAG: DNA primase [Crocinitomicaceae bacterium]|nr:DNA primase [Crocinitomicaceae bacterium]MDG2465388.1 DNA primase [Crocinitomicaceae bacterium]